MVLLDGKLFHELARKKVEMEAMYANRVEEVIQKNAVEVQAMVVKSKAKIATEEKRHLVLKKETLEADVRWGECLVCHSALYIIR